MSGAVWYDQSCNKWLRWDARRNKWRPLYPWWRQPTVWLAIAVVAGAGAGQYRATRTWTPLQRAYAVSYVWSALAIKVGLHEGTYNLLWIRERSGSHIALDSDVEGVQAPPDAPGHRSGNVARQAGARRLEWTAGRNSHALVYGFLRTVIYRDRGVAQLLIPALWGAVVVLLTASLCSIAPPTWRWLRTGRRRRSVSDRPSESAPGPSPDAAEETPTPVPIAAVPAPAAAPTERSEPSPTPRPQPPTPFFE